MSQIVEEHDQQEIRDDLIYKIALRHGMEKGLFIGFFFATLLAILSSYLANL